MNIHRKRKEGVRQQSDKTTMIRQYRREPSPTSIDIQLSADECVRSFQLEMPPHKLSFLAWLEQTNICLSVIQSVCKCQLVPNEALRLALKKPPICSVLSHFGNWIMDNRVIITPLEGAFCLWHTGILVHGTGIDRCDYIRVQTWFGDSHCVDCF